MIQISGKTSNKLWSGGCSSRTNAKLKRRLSNENEKVSFEKLFTSELERNSERDKSAERDKAADKTKNKRNRNIRLKILQSQR